MSRLSALLVIDDQKQRTAGERRGAVPPVSHRYNGRELGQQIRQRPPQVGIVLLQTLQLVRVQAAIAVGMDGRLIEIVCTAPLERHKLLDGFKVNVEHIAAQRHFSDIGAHVADARLGHALPNDLQLVRPYPHIDGDAADALLCQRSSRSRLRRLGGCSRTLSSGFSSGGGTGRLLMMPSI